MRATASQQLTWRQLHFAGPLDVERVVACLRQWAADSRSPQLVLEARANAGAMQYLLATPSAAVSSVRGVLGHELGASAQPLPAARTAVSLAVRLRASTRHRPLRVADTGLVIRALLGALTRARRTELLVLQVVLGPRRVPLAVSNDSPTSAVMPWWLVAWRGHGGVLDSERRAALRSKVGDHGFACTVRLGVVAATVERRHSLLASVLAALRTSETPGLRLGLIRSSAAALDAAARPWRWPLRLSVAELALLTGWPIGDDLPGQPAAHPRRLPPSPGTASAERVIGELQAPGYSGPLSLGVQPALHHLHVVGPTGVGKSTLLEGLIAQDIASGYSVVVIEPKGDLVRSVLAHIPSERQAGVVVLDPSDPSPVGLNPLATAGRRPELVADNLLAVFKQLYGAAIGPRSQDILYAGLLTLARARDASLVMLPLLLTNASFRRSLTADLDDPLMLGPFWASFDAWGAAERAAAIGPVMNKLRPLLRPGLRAVLGQRAPRFDLAQVMRQPTALLVPLQRGIIGSEAAGLLGSLVVAELWQVIQARAAVAERDRRPVMVYIDEVQDYLHLPTDLGTALAQARGYGAGFTLSHQFLGQLSPAMRSAVLANTRSRVCFQLAAADGPTLAKGHPELSSEDLTLLGRFEIYASLFNRGQVTPYASARTLAPSPRLSHPGRLRQASRAAWGRPLDEIERDFATLLASTDGPVGSTGRRRRQP